jgi:sterol desaturase/sphingolipid hydroxylase (fatty acid hydroxylase superfamily)
VTFSIIRAAGFISAIAIGLWLERRARHAPSRASWRVNGGLWALDGLLLAGVCGACACSVALWAARTRFGVLNAAAAPLPIALPATILGLDLVSYAWHRANHRVALLWRFHRVHHSDASFTVATGLRFHPGELLLSLPLRLAAIAVIGAPVEAVAAFEVVFTLANLLEHGNIDLPPGLEERLSRISITPALHRFHHSRRHLDLDSNFGTIFSIWDRLLGTYRPSSSAAAIEVGLPGLPSPTSLLGALRLPLNG